MGVWRKKRHRAYALDNCEKAMGDDGDQTASVTAASGKSDDMRREVRK